MSIKGFLIPRGNDKKLIDSVSKFYSDYEDKIGFIEFEFASGERINWQKPNDWKEFIENEAFLELISSNTFLINIVKIWFRNFRVTFTRGELLTERSAIFDEIKTSLETSNSGQFNILENLKLVEKIQILKALEQSLGKISNPKLIESNLPKEYEALLSQHNHMLNKLEELNSELISKNHLKSNELDESYSIKISKLTDEFEKKKSELENDYLEKIEANQKSIEVRADELNDYAESLEKRSKALDDRDNTHVRREIRDKMLDDVKTRINDFGVSESTNQKRKPVIAGFILLISFFLIMLSVSIFQLSMHHSEGNSVEVFSDILAKTAIDKVLEKKDGKSFLESALLSEVEAKIEAEKSIFYWLWLRVFVSSLGLVASILYYIKWQNKWAEFHSESEFQLQQFYIDVNRANWVIESCLEWKKETNSEIPPSMLESMTRNLFTNENSKMEQVVNPSDELASALLGSASKLKMNISGNELEIDKPGKIKPQSTQS